MSVPTAVADGIPTRFEVTGSGPPLLMFSPGGFDSTLESWRTVGIHRRLDLLGQLATRYTCITFDRRESGRSGGRVERLTWDRYVAQAVGLLDHLGIERAHLVGACVGCSSAAAMAVAQPGRVRSTVLFSPAGGVRYRLRQQDRFARHLAHVQAHGLDGVAELVRASDAGFSADPRVGPWNSVIRTDPAFAAAYVAQDVASYGLVVTGTARLLFDRDTVPGPEPEDLLRLDVPALVVPGHDESHAPSAAHYLRECLPRAQFWDAGPAGPTRETAAARVMEFLGAV
ncbi:alpha/beta hydrolase [Pseudonocardia zijingensis]|uniref:alpha/beta fold hydrolase n=1 Tax=Pseudonocardia zijingensis TaxID=153376 RepID=UPI0031DA637C